MPGNRVNIRLVVKPKSTPFVDPTPPKSTVVSKSGFPIWFKAVGILAGEFFVLWVIVSAITPNQNTGIFNQQPTTPAPTLISAAPQTIGHVRQVVFSPCGITDCSRNMNLTLQGNETDVWNYTPRETQVVDFWAAVDYGSPEGCSNGTMSITTSPGYILVSSIDFGGGVIDSFTDMAVGGGGGERTLQGGIHYSILINIPCSNQTTYYLLLQ